MPTVLRTGGYRFYFYSHEPNEPPHIHIDKAGATVKVWLNPVSVARSSGFAAHELAEVVGLVRNARTKLVEDRHEFFG
jgi:hypothetical protein